MRGNALRFAGPKSGAYGEHHPLLAAQEGIWTAQRLDPDSPVHNTALSVRIQGPMDPALFERALRHTVAEVEALNLRFVVDVEGRPRQLAVGGTEWQPYVADLTAAEDPEGAAGEWMARDMARPVDLVRDPLFCHALLRTAPEQFLWYHRAHGIALDDAGLALVAQRVARVYTALAQDVPPGDSGFGTLESVIREERAYQESDDAAMDRAYWTRRFADGPVSPGLAPEPAFPAREVLRHVADLGPTGVEALRSAARRLSVTWQTVLLAVTAAHVHQWTGESDVVLSLPAESGPDSASRRVPGLPRGTLPLRVSVESRDSLRTLTARVSDELRAGRPHQRYRAGRLRRDLGPVGRKRRLSGPRVAVLQFEDLHFAGHPGTVQSVSAGPVDDVSISFCARADGSDLRIAVEASAYLYDEAETATRLRGLTALLHEVTAAPDRAVGRRRPVAVPDAGRGPHRQARPVLSLVADHAARRGGATAVEHGRQRITYAELFGAARRLARRLAARNVGPGSTVAVALPHGIDAVTAFLGVLMSGAAYCPLDPAARTSRRSALLDDADPVLVLTGGDHAGQFPGRAVLVIDSTGPDAQAPVQATRTSGEPACVIYASESAGPPERTEISHGSLAAFAAGATRRHGPRRAGPPQRFAVNDSGAGAVESLLALCSGMTVVMRADDTTGSVPLLLP